MMLPTFLLLKKKNDYSLGSVFFAGSGKHSQAMKVAETFGFTHIAIRDYQNQQVLCSQKVMSECAVVFISRSVFVCSVGILATNRNETSAYVCMVSWINKGSHPPGDIRPLPTCNVVCLNELDFIM